MLQMRVFIVGANDRGGESVVVVPRLVFAVVVVHDWVQIHADGVEAV